MTEKAVEEERVYLLICLHCCYHQRKSEQELKQARNLAAEADAEVMKDPAY